MASSEDKSLDIFGKPLEITEQERAVLGDDAARVFLRRVLSIETHTKKGTVSDPKTLVVSSSRCHVIAQKPSIKLETSFNFLKITLIECSEKKLVFHLSGENRPREFTTDRKNGVTIVGLILAQLKNLFPVTPLDTLIKVSYNTESINSEVSLLHESLRQAMESSDPNSLESFITIYGFLCDLHNIPYIPEISSYLRAAYWTHGFRELNLKDFEHFSIRDLLPLVATLRHNNYFDSFSVDGMKVSVEVFEELAHALVHSQTLKKLKLTNCSLKPDVLFQYCIAWKTNSKSVLSHIDLSKNQLDDKFIDSFCTGLESLQHGLQTLKLSNCRISTKVGSLIANAMKQNQDLLYSLTHFDLSENPLGPDSQGPLVFLKEPQTVTTLNLSKCGLNFELVFPILLRGCQQHLRDLDLSQNRINVKKLNVTSLGQIMQQFFSSAISLQAINLSDCKLTPDLAIAIMEGLSVNPNISDTTLNLSSNELGHGLDVRSMSDSLSRLKKVNSLNISNTNIDQHLSRLIEALGLNRSIKHLNIGQNFEGREKIEGVKQLCRMIKADDCCLETLDISDSKLKEVTSAILNSLIYNDSIVKLDISGNGMGTHGLRAMVKLLLSGTQLKELHCSNNDITASGLTNIADAIEHNYTILSISCPLSDIVKVAAKDGDIIEEALMRIQRYLCRNHSDEKLEMKLAKIRQKTLLATSQQSALISREVVQVEGMLSNLSRAEKKPTNYDTEVERAKAVKEEANKVLQLVDSLYSPQKESQQFEIIVKRMNEVMEREVEGLYREFVQENIETMVTQSVKSCPLLLTESDRETLRQIGRRELQSELQETKKAVARRTASEIINRISRMNLDTAAVISELIVDRTLDELEGCTGRLHSMSERIAGSPSKRVSKIFSFRTKDQATPMGKRRRRKDDVEEDDDEIVLPSDPLTTDGPTLQHLGNKRPRPPRRNQNRPAGLKKAAETGPSSIWDPVPASDDTDNNTAVETKKETDKPVQQAILPKVNKSSQDKDTPPPKTPTTPSAKDEIPDTVPLPVKSDESTPSSPSEEKTEERKLAESSKKKSGITKFFGSRKEKDKTPPPTSPTPSSTGTATPTSTAAASPTHSNDSGEKIKENGSKEGGEEKGDGETGTVDIKRASEIVSDEYIVVPKTKQPPPTVKTKPQKSSPDGESDTTSAPSGGWKPPGRAGDSVGQLANVLMQGGGIPLLKPTKNKDDKDKEEKKEDDGSAEKRDGPPRSPPPVKNKPKRPSGKAPANGTKESTSKNENVDGAAEKEENDEESIEV